MAQDVTNPRRILAISLDSSAHHLSRLIQDLTGAAPAAESLAGSTHLLPLATRYYTATVPVWLDTIASPAEWASSFLSDEARPVLDVLGALVLVFALPPHGPPSGDATTANLIRHVGEVVDGLGGWEWDGVRLAVGVGVGVGEGDADDWEELCAAAGLEFVQLPAAADSAAQVNEFGEKTGVARVKEALEANDWALDTDDLDLGGADDNDDDHDDDDDDDDDHKDSEALGFGVDEADMQSLRRAIFDDAGSAAAQDNDENDNDNDNEEEDRQEDMDDEDVAKVERMMRKLQAAREMGEGMNGAQRRRFAARAVGEVMRDL